MSIDIRGEKLNGDEWECVTEDDDTLNLANGNANALMKALQVKGDRLTIEDAMKAILALDALLSFEVYDDHTHIIVWDYYRHSFTMLTLKASVAGATHITFF